MIRMGGGVVHVFVYVQVDVCICIRRAVCVSWCVCGGCEVESIL